MTAEHGAPPPLERVYLLRQVRSTGWLGPRRPWLRRGGPLLARPVHPLREAHRPLGCPSAPAQARVRALPLDPGTALR